MTDKCIRELKPNKQDFESIKNRMRKNTSILRKEKRNFIKEGDRNLEHFDSKQLENILVNINGCFCNNDFSNAFSLMKRISKSEVNSIDVFFSRNLFDPIFYILSSENNINIQLCLDNLIEIIGESFGSISLILNEDFMNILSKLFNYNNSIRISVMNLLSEISSHGVESCNFLLESNIIDFYLSNGDIENSKVYICKTIRNIFYFKAQVNNVILLDMLKISKRFLFDSDSSCKLDIIYSFLHTLDDSLICVDDILDKTIASYLIELLLNKNESINFPIFQILSFAYVESKTLKSILLESSILSRIPDLFPFSTYDCWKECIFFLSNVASGNSDDIAVLRKCNLLPCVAFSMTNGTHRIQDEAIYFFKNVSKEESADEIQFWFTKEIVLVFCDLLKPGNIDRNCIILDALLCALIFSNNSEELVQIINDCNLVNAIEESNFHMTDCGYKLYKDIVSILSGEDLSESMIDENMTFAF